MSQALLTDLYQLTMGQAYWKTGMADRESVFHLFFRKLPFGSGFAVAAGLAPAMDWVRALRFSAEDLDYLRHQTAEDGSPLFRPAYLAHLRDFCAKLDIDAVPEGTPVFPNEPILRVRGPLLAAQLVETALLNVINFQTLIATKAARVRHVAGADTVLEFGLRRAQGPDGGVSASRAAFLGGVDATSNVLAGQTFGIPVRGTHAHSLVMAFEDERAAFAAYADAMPHNCTLLVDTYDTVQGTRHAIEVGLALRSRGHRLAAIRLDSGDLLALSRTARLLLDEAGLTDTAIVASSDLDETKIAELKAAGAPIAIWGVGTRLVTGHDQPALGGVYKLSAIRGPAGTWEDRAKRSSDPIKASIPGILQVRRRSDGDILYDERWGCDGAGGSDLLVPVLRNGGSVGSLPTLPEARAHAAACIRALPEGTRRINDPIAWPVHLEPRVHARRMELLA